jgi:hypothetical protein
MRRIRSKITYANIVATLALFIALGGVSYAAVKLPANSVGEKQIKKNAVTGKKIKKNAITGDKIKPGTIKGTDISLASLGKVPSAASADVAASAGNSNTTSELLTVSKRVIASGLAAGSVDIARSQAPEVPLLTDGQVSVYGKCYFYSGSIYAEVLSKTTVDGTLVNSYSNDGYDGGAVDGYLNTTTPETDRQIYDVSTGINDAEDESSVYYGQGHIVAPNGNSLTYNLGAWAKYGTPPDGNGAYGAGNVCIFAGNGTPNPAS